MIHVLNCAYATKEEIDDNTSIILLHEFDDPIRPIDVDYVGHIVNCHLENQCKTIIDAIDGKVRIKLSSDDWDAIHPKLLESDKFANKIIKSLLSNDFVVSASVDIEIKDKPKFLGFMNSARYSNLTDNKFIQIHKDMISSCINISVIMSKDIITSNKLYVYHDITSSISSVIDDGGFIQLYNFSIYKDYINMELILLL